MFSFRLESGRAIPTKHKTVPKNNNPFDPDLEKQQPLQERTNHPGNSSAIICPTPPKIGCPTPPKGNQMPQEDASRITSRLVHVLVAHLHAKLLSVDILHAFRVRLLTCPMHPNDLNDLPFGTFTKNGPGKPTGQKVGFGQ